MSKTLPRRRSHPPEPHVIESPSTFPPHSIPPSSRRPPGTQAEAEEREARKTRGPLDDHRRPRRPHPDSMGPCFPCFRGSKPVAGFVVKRPHARLPAVAPAAAVGDRRDAGQADPRTAPDLTERRVAARAAARAGRGAGVVAAEPATCGGRAGRKATRARAAARGRRRTAGMALTSRRSDRRRCRPSGSWWSPRRQARRSAPWSHRW